MNTIDVKNMSSSERLQAMEVLWDALLHENGEIESPEWHRDPLEARRSKLEKGTATFLSIEKLRASRGT